MISNLGRFSRVNSLQLDYNISATHTEIIALQSIACSNLCELSNHICDEDYEAERERKLQQKRENYGFSPWKLKNQSAPNNLSSRNKKYSLKG